METVPRLYRRVRPQADYRQSLDVLAFARRYRAGACSPNPDSWWGWARPKKKCAALLRDLRAAGTDVATIGQYLQPTRRNLPVAAYIEPRAVRRVSRLRPVARASRWCSAARWCAAPTWPTRSARKRDGRRAELAAGAGYRRPLLILAFPRFNLVWLAPVALTPAAGGGGARAAAVAALPAGLDGGRGLLVRRLLLDPVRAGGSRRPGRRRLAGRCSCCSASTKALHMGVFALLAGILMRRWWAVPGGGRAVGGDRGHARIAGLRLAGAGQCRNRHGAAAAPGALHRRLRALVRLRDDGDGAGAGACCGGPRAGTGCGCWRCRS